MPLLHGAFSKGAESHKVYKEEVCTDFTKCTEALNTSSHDIQSVYIHIHVYRIPASIMPTAQRSVTNALTGMLRHHLIVSLDHQSQISRQVNGGKSLEQTGRSNLAYTLYSINI